MTIAESFERFTGVRFFPRTRAKFTETMLYLGELSELGWDVLQMIVRGPVETKLIIAQFESIGVKSLSIVAITSLFIGMVLALQTAYSLAEFGGKLFIGKVVSLSLVRELAPVLMSLMVGGRVGAGMTAELGTMKVTEQIDALRALATNPIRKLVFPRVFSTTVMFPLLTVISCFVGSMGGRLIATGHLHLDASFYLRSASETVAFDALRSGAIKTL